MVDYKFESREHRFWFALLNFVAATVFVGVATLCLWAAAAVGNVVGMALACLVALYLDLNAVALAVHGGYQLIEAVR